VDFYERLQNEELGRRRSAERRTKNQCCGRQDKRNHATELLSTRLSEAIRLKDWTLVEELDKQMREVMQERGLRKRQKKSLEEA